MIRIPFIITGCKMAARSLIRSSLQQIVKGRTLPSIARREYSLLVPATPVTPVTPEKFRAAIRDGNQHSLNAMYAASLTPEKSRDVNAMLTSFEASKAAGLSSDSPDAISMAMAAVKAARQQSLGNEQAKLEATLAIVRKDDGSLSKRVQEHFQGADHADTTEYWMWFCLATFPVVLLLCIRGYWMEMAHLDHLEEHGPPEFINYSHMQIRTKDYPWGDGSHNLFHNKWLALPDGFAVDENYSHSDTKRNWRGVKTDV